MSYLQLMQTTRFVVFQLANFFLFFFPGKYFICLFFTSMAGSIACTFILKNNKKMLLNKILKQELWAKYLLFLGYTKL